MPVLPDGQPSRNTKHPQKLGEVEEQGGAVSVTYSLETKTLQKNEQLTAADQEFRNRDQELSSAVYDLTNLLTSTALPIFMLDSELRLCQMTAAAGEVLNLQPADLGRKIGETNIRLNIEAIEPLVRGVFETSQPNELEWEGHDGRLHAVRARPYRTANNRMEGVVLALIDIDELRKTRNAANTSRGFAENVVQSTRIPLLVLHDNFQVRFANSAFYQLYGGTLADTEQCSFFQIDGGLWDLPGARTELEKLLGTANVQVMDELEFEREFAGLGKRTVCINARLIEPDGETLILLAIEDVTAQKHAERLLRDEQARLELSLQTGTLELKKTSKTLRKEVSGRRRAEAALHESKSALLESREQLRELAASLINAQDAERRRVALELHDGLSQQIANLQFGIERLEQYSLPGSTAVKQKLQDLVEQAGTLADDVRRVAHQLHPSSLDQLGLAVAMRSYTKEFSRSAAIQVNFTSHKVPRDIPIELASGLYRIVQEALRNVGKHAGATASVEIGLQGTPGGLELSIEDDGEGFDLESQCAKGGLGLIGMRERVRLAGGSIALAAQPGQGVKITIHVPLQKVGV